MENCAGRIWAENLGLVDCIGNPVVVISPLEQAIFFF